jgi:hypothetical protein
LHTEQPRAVDVAFEANQESASINIALNVYPIDPLPSRETLRHELLCHMASVSGTGCPTIIKPDQCIIDVQHDIDRAIISFENLEELVYQSQSYFDIKLKRRDNFRGKTLARCRIVNFQELSEVFQVCLEASPVHDVLFDVGADTAVITLELPGKPIKISKPSTNLIFELVQVNDAGNTNVHKMTFPEIDEKKSICTVTIKHDIGTLFADHW